MSKYIKVALSPFYNGIGWIDKKTGIKFVKGGLMQHYTIPVSSDLTDIKRQVMLNNLLLIEGDLDLIVNDEYVEVSKRDFEALKAENTILKSEKTTLEAENTTLEEENTTLKSEKTTLEAEVVRLTAEVAQLEEDNQRLTSEVSTLQEKLDALEKEPETDPEPAEVPEEGLEEETYAELGVYSEEEADALTVTEIKAELDRLEIDYTSDARKAELVELLTGQPKAE